MALSHAGNKNGRQNSVTVIAAGKCRLFSPPVKKEPFNPFFQCKETTREEKIFYKIFATILFS